jgi:hypothetical protein
MNSRIRIGWLQTSMGALFLVFALCGFAAAQNLQDFFSVNHQATPVGKLKADNGSVTCTHLITKFPTTCNDTSYAAQCASGICGCMSYTCTNAGGTLGTGTGTLELGIDLANGPTLGFSPDCYPIFGVYNGTSKKDTSEETDFDGVACDPLGGTTVVVNGGWQLVAWNLTSIVNGAGGTLTGTLNLSSSALKLSLKGKTF